MSRLRLPALFAWLAFAPACGSSPIEGTKVCRRYPTTFIEAGLSYTCTFDVRILTCRDSSHFVVQDWWYAGSADFVQEAQVPNRILAKPLDVETVRRVLGEAVSRTDH